MKKLYIELQDSNLKKFYILICNLKQNSYSKYQELKTLMNVKRDNIMWIVLSNYGRKIQCKIY